MTFADSLNTLQSNKVCEMTDRKALLTNHKALLPQLTEKQLSVMTKICHCSLAISALLTSSAFSCRASEKSLVFACTHLQKALAAVCTVFPPGPADTS